MSENLTQLLLKRSDWFADEIMRGIQRSPWPHITPAQSRLLALMGGKSASMAALGRRLAISRQAVHKTVNELVRQGILEVKVDPERGNAKLVSYTEAGRQVNRAGANLIEQAERKLADRIGQSGVEQLKQLLQADWDDADDVSDVSPPNADAPVQASRNKRRDNPRDTSSA
ncbi:MAG: MarR family winged helix-turn-helix transcriptional regulator [Burkholderiaceae bacterium]